MYNRTVLKVRFFSIIKNIIYEKMIKFPSIEQFRTVVTNVNRHFNYIGLMKMVMQYMMLPFQNQNLPFKGTVKLHGTNAAVCYNTSYGPL
jgi:hypothetical protein